MCLLQTVATEDCRSVLNQDTSLIRTLLCCKDVQIRAVPLYYLHLLIDTCTAHNPQCNTAGLSLTEELLYVHKAQAVVEFCGECKKLLKAFKLEINSPEGVVYTLYTYTLNIVHVHANDIHVHVRSESFWKDNATITQYKTEGSHVNELHVPRVGFESMTFAF